MIKNYTNLGEKVIEEVLPNGLKLIMVPRANYHQCVAVLSTRFGSLTQKVTVDGQNILDIPAGTAHFLEHKLFDKQDEDAFYRFSQLGADANAFTTNLQTSYYFSTSQNLAACLQHLLDFVQIPYFDQSKVVKERGIIEQEIQMYQDDPEWRLYMTLLEQLYPKSPLALDIAGSPASLKQITDDLLYQIHHIFYQPKNLTLQVVGKFDPTAIFNLVQANQANKVPAIVDFKTFNPTLETRLSQDFQVTANVTIPKAAWGIRFPAGDWQGLAMSRRSLVADLLLDILFGEQTTWYQDLYNKSIIDDNFDFEYVLMPQYQYLTFFSQTHFYTQLETALCSRLENYHDYLLNHQQVFLELQAATLGEAIIRLNSLEQIALRGDDILCGVNLFDKIDVLKEIKFKDILDLADQLFNQFELSRVILKK
ncbi:EF-P 5-aminopentanol modification-associated protein YfmH [Convivina praedatoris]|uniref:Insulinase family protein n=1 Tax=Convivina praedatoris TaxID=2880963 RepID=A0ABN8HDP9_9LACO|nr:pitrilysin family protein [Convivina sp. LMG 32447]CAH1854064.1 hypothetical protein R077815_00958 [Convivina sp. LMG 32447]CAH1855332.1 hypothetical protein R078138_01093 [Convivina sp. LMG 32447]CAH1855419.1 hypothetical protein LMG032447_01072 [Convivina sp. LMG 32447]